MRPNPECTACGCGRFSHYRGRGTCTKCGRCERFTTYEREARQPLADAELLELDASWRDGWAQEFPGEAYPGLVEARRRIRAKLDAAVKGGAA